MLSIRNSGRLSRAVVVSAALSMWMACSAKGEIINVPDDYPTIQEAIDAAQDGDEIVVAEGNYHENLDLLGKAVTLRSTDPDDPTVVADAVIDGDGMGTVVTCASGEGAQTVISGFTIYNGSAVDGGGMRIIASSPTVTACWFYSNSAEDGGGIYNGDNAGPAIVACLFTRNTAARHGAGICNIDSHPTVTDCTFTQNVADAHGGGMYTLNHDDPADFAVSNCTFAGNSGGSGGGMYNAHCDPAVTACTFIGNYVEISGGSVYSRQGYPSFTDCSLIGNTAAFCGAGMCNWDGGAIVTQCSFTANSGPFLGGGICNFGGSDIAVIGCGFTENTAIQGGGMDNHECEEVVVVACVFANNQAYRDGGGVFNQRSDPALTNCVFSANVADRGAGVCNYNLSPVLVTNCSFAGNLAEEGGGISNWGYSTPGVFNCILWGNEGGAICSDPHSLLIVSYTLVQGGYEGEGNIDADPLFVDPAGGDYRIAPGSPCIDAGNNRAVPEGVVTDLAGDPRFADDPATEDTGHGEPPIVDMGAYEFQPPTCPADFDGDGDVDTSDLLILLSQWGTDGSFGGDVDGDGDVDTADLLALLGAWGECPE